MPAPSKLYPLKEFTVYPKVPKDQSNDDANSKKEVLLMLKEDGSFQQYSSDEQQIPDKVRFFDGKKQKNVKGNGRDDEDEDADDDEDDILDRYCEFGKLKGKWNLVGGRLILAADRPMDEQGKSNASLKPNQDIADTILEGEVVATTEQGLVDNPVLGADPKRDDEETRASGSGDPGPSSGRSSSSNISSSSNSSSNGNIDINSSNSNGDGSGSGSGSSGSNSAKRGVSSPSAGGGGAPPSKTGNRAGSGGSVLDTHLSVPKGRVNVGRFTYPIHHPSFFDAPMFNPRAGGKFELKQVLGTLNTKQPKEDEELVEKFRPSDFYNKTFLLSSRPIPEYQPKGTKRWSIKYNKFVEDPPPKSKEKQQDDESMLDQPMHNIRVLELKFFSNNTFATIGGMGGSAILRGRFSVIGDKRDHIWMQVMRFGFGRSVSGSVFSEGRSLSKDDEKAYWGKIQYANDGSDGKAQKKKKKNSGDAGTETGDKDPKLIVKGSVLFGYGLEPLPIGLFVLTETNTAEEYDLDEDDLDDDSDDDDDDDDDEDDDEDDGGSDDDNNSEGFNDGQFFLDSDNVFQ